MVTISTEKSKVEEAPNKTNKRRCPEGYVYDEELGRCVPEKKNSSAQITEKESVIKKPEETDESEKTLKPEFKEVQGDKEDQGGLASGVIFNDDGTVSYSIAGETFNLSKEEYEILIGRKAGQISENVRRIQEIRTSGKEFGDFSVAGKQTALDQKQVQELQMIDRLKNTAEQDEMLNKLALAGHISFANAARAISGGLIDIDPASAKEKAKSPVGREVGAIVGAFTTAGIGEFRLATAVSSNYRGNIRNLQSDSGNLVSESNKILQQTLTRSSNRPSANLQQSIESQEKIESAVRQRYLDAMESLKRSPTDIAQGLDLTDSMSRDLRIVVENRQMLERYKLTGNPQEIITYLGGISEEE